MINFEKHFYELDTLGFTIVKDVITKEYAQLVKKKLIESLETEKKKFENNTYYASEHLADLCSADPFFLEFLDNEVMHTIYSHFLGETCILYTYSSTIVVPKKIGASHNIHVDSPRHIPNYIGGLQMTVALDDFTEENGASLYLPGSHKTEAAPSEDTFNQYASKVTRRSGDALFFNPRVFHRAGVNNTNEKRFAFSTYAVRAYMKPRFDFTRIVPNYSMQGVSERTKRFLGFNVRVPGSLEEFYVSPEKRLYKSNQG